MGADDGSRAKRWVPISLGAVLSVGLGYGAFRYAVSPSLSLFYIGNAYWAGLHWSSTTPLFGYLVLLFGHSTVASEAGFDAAAGAVCILFALSSYLVLTGLLGRWYAGVLGAVIGLASPFTLSVVGDSAYSVLLAFTLLLPALYFGNQTLKRFTEGGLILATLFAAATSLADPLVGAVLALTLAIMIPRAAYARNRLYASTVAVATLTALLGLLVISPGPSVPWGSASSLILLVAAPAALLGVYFNWRTDSDSVLPLGALSLASTAVSLLLGTQYAILALLLTSSALLLNVRKLTFDSIEGGTKFVRVDLTKVASALLVGVIVVGDLGVTAIAFRSTTNADAAIIARYGSPELIQTMSWLQSNTPPGSVVLSEYPLSLWVQSLGDRTPLSNNLTSSSQGFITSYNADMMLNSTYELRNGYMRVRDWAPIAPQRSPAISVASGNQYLNALYIDENHLVLLGPTGAPIAVPYANFTKLSSGFVVVNGTLSLQQRYVIGGVNVDRDVSMGSGAQVTIEYVIHANQSGLISGAKVQLWVSKDRTVGYTSLSGGTLQLDLDAGNLIVTSKGPQQSVTFGPDPVYGQPNLLARYNSTSTTFSFSLTISGLNVNRVSWARGLETITTLNLYQVYHVSYLIVPTVVKQRQVDLFGLYFPTFTSVYQNDKLTIYQVLVGAP